MSNENETFARCFGPNAIYLLKMYMFDLKYAWSILIAIYTGNFTGIRVTLLRKRKTASRRCVRTQYIIINTLSKMVDSK